MHTSPRRSARRARAANNQVLVVRLSRGGTAGSGLAHAARAALVGVLSTLIVVLPVPFRRSVARADPANVTLDSESFNFPSQSASSDENSTASASANALKQRTSPVTASGSFSTSVPSSCRRGAAP